MSNRFPTEYEAWKNDVARRLVALQGNVNNIMIGLPQIPGPEIGMPFTGPLSPVPFVWPSVNNEQTGGTTGTRADHCSICPNASRKYEFTVSGIANRTCLTCSAANGTFILEAVDGQGSGSEASTACLWRSSKVIMCSEFSYPSGEYWWLMEIGYDAFSNPQVTVSLCNSSISASIAGVTMVQYQRSDCPPPHGSGSGNFVINRLGPSPLNRCQTYPASITLRVVS